MIWCMSCSRCDSSRSQLTPTNRTRENTLHPQCECHRDGKVASYVLNTLGHQAFLVTPKWKGLTRWDEVEITLFMQDTILSQKLSLRCGVRVFQCFTLNSSYAGTLVRLTGRQTDSRREVGQPIPSDETKGTNRDNRAKFVFGCRERVPTIKRRTWGNR